MGWGTAIAIGATLLGNEINRRNNLAAVRKKTRLAEEGFRRRTQEANERLKPLFKKGLEDVSPEKEKELLSAEDIKNINTINKTKAVMDKSLVGGLETGGKQSGKFQKLREDRFKNSFKRQNLRDIAFSRFLSPNRTAQIRGQAPIDVSLGRGLLADELIADRNINDMRISAVHPDAFTQFIGDALRIGGTAYGLYNAGASLGTEAVNPYTEIWGPSLGSTADAADIGSTATIAPWYDKAWNSLGNLFTPAQTVLPQSDTGSRMSSLFSPNSYGGGARFGIAPNDVTRFSPVYNPPSPAWGYGNGNWFGGRG